MHSKTQCQICVITMFILQCTNNMLSNAQPTICDRPNKHEEKFFAVCKALFLEGNMPPGSVIDCGANDGSETCHYATLAPDRIIHAVEPIYVNWKHIKQKYAELSNLRVLRAGLGSKPFFAVEGKTEVGEQIVGLTPVDGEAPKSHLRQDIFPVYRLDDLFNDQWSGEKMGFGHFDVEGGERELLLGASQTIARDRPLFTFEAHVWKNITLARELIEFASARDYAVFMVNEACGRKQDCRNFLCVPREWLERSVSSAIYHGFLRGDLVSVNSESIVNMANPCCHPGGPCCRHNGHHCCNRKVVTAYYKSLTRRGNTTA